MDMLRFHRFTAGRFWTDDYGSSEDPQEFEALLAYSPYHNIRSGVDYPALLITTSDTDDRVVPSHSFKYAAALQAAETGSAPKIIRIETRAGHGAGKSTEQQIEEWADKLAFLAEHLGVVLMIVKSPSSAGRPQHAGHLPGSLHFPSVESSPYIPVGPPSSGDERRNPREG